MRPDTLRQTLSALNKVTDVRECARAPEASLAPAGPFQAPTCRAPARGEEREAGMSAPLGVFVPPCAQERLRACPAGLVPNQRVR